jgi:methionine synthase II (cobalamin-independent)
LLNRVVAGFTERMRIGLHVCRGNWSKRDDVLITGDYQPLVGCFQKMNIRQFVLEYATPRAGELAVVGNLLTEREIGLGCVNPRTDEAEPISEIIARCKEALNYWRPEQIFLNPDCGFGCFANRCVNVERVAYEKLCAMVQAAKAMRARYG